MPHKNNETDGQSALEYLYRQLKARLFSAQLSDADRDRIEAQLGEIERKRLTLRIH